MPLKLLNPLITLVNDVDIASCFVYSNPLRVPTGGT